MSLWSINFLHLTIAEIWPGQDFQTQGHHSKVKGQIKVTPWYCIPTPLTNVPTKYQLSYASRFLRYSLDKLLAATHPDSMDENNTLTALKGCGVKIVEKNGQLLTSSILLDSMLLFCWSYKYDVNTIMKPKYYSFLTLFTKGKLVE